MWQLLLLMSRCHGKQGDAQSRRTHFQDGHFAELEDLEYAGKDNVDSHLFQLMCGTKGPFGERCCQLRQTAALGSAPDLTETSPSISHIV